LLKKGDSIVLYRIKCACHENDKCNPENPDADCDHVLRIAYLNPEKAPTKI
jgi:hypothetical protein